MAARARKAKIVGTENVTIALAHVRALVSFNGVRLGDESVTELNDTVRGWAAAGLVEVTDLDPVPGTLVLEESDDGEDPAGPGEPEPDIQGAGEA